jgi:hypothetical protein
MRHGLEFSFKINKQWFRDEFPASDYNLLFDLPKINSGKPVFIDI